MNENKTNAPIKLPVRYDPEAMELVDGDGKNLSVTFDYLTDEVAQAYGDQIVAALNEADALRSILADATVIESDDWSMSYNGNPNKLIALREVDSRGNLISYTHHDSFLEAYAATKPKDAETS